MHGTHAKMIYTIQWHTGYISNRSHTNVCCWVCSYAIKWYNVYFHNFTHAYNAMIWMRTTHIFHGMSITAENYIWNKPGNLHDMGKQRDGITGTFHKEVLLFVMLKFYVWIWLLLWKLEKTPPLLYRGCHMRNNSYWLYYYLLRYLHPSAVLTLTPDQFCLTSTQIKIAACQYQASTRTSVDSPLLWTYNSHAKMINAIKRHTMFDGHRN